MSTFYSRSAVTKVPILVQQECDAQALPGSGVPQVSSSLSRPTLQPINTISQGSELAGGVFGDRPVSMGGGTNLDEGKGDEGNKDEHDDSDNTEKEGAAAHRKESGGSGRSKGKGKGTTKGKTTDWAGRVEG